MYKKEGLGWIGRKSKERKKLNMLKRVKLEEG
jgi:hypothetical protein